MTKVSMTLPRVNLRRRARRLSQAKTACSALCGRHGRCVESAPRAGLCKERSDSTVPDLQHAVEPRQWPLESARHPPTTLAHPMLLRQADAADVAQQEGPVLLAETAGSGLLDLEVRAARRALNDCRLLALLLVQETLCGI